MNEGDPEPGILNFGALLCKELAPLYVLADPNRELFFSQYKKFGRGGSPGLGSTLSYHLYPKGITPKALPLCMRLSFLCT